MTSGRTCWKCNFPINLHVSLLVDQSVDRYLHRSVIISYKAGSYTSMHLSEHLFLPWRTGAVCLGAGGRQREDVVAVLVQVEDVIVLVVILKKKKLRPKLASHCSIA